MMTPLDAVLTEYMKDQTALDARLRVFEQFLSAELFIALKEEPVEDVIKPLLFDISDGRFALVFDKEDRLTSFLGGVQDFACLSGRALLELFRSQDVGLGVNLSQEESCALFTPEDLDWCAQFAVEPEQSEQKFLSVRSVVDFPPELLAALDRKIASLSGFAKSAYLVSLQDATGTSRNSLVFTDALLPSEKRIAETISETVRLSDSGHSLDVVFLPKQHSAISSIEKFGLRFDISEPEQAQPLQAPGSDPSKPPKLR